MLNVLFVGVHNSARSQMGETVLNDLGKNLFHAESAGLQKGSLNQNVVQVMKEVGYDISQNPTNSVFEFFKEGRDYTFVIKICDEINGQRCPIFPNSLHDIYWNLPNPSSFQGTTEDILQRTREIRDEIKERVLAFIEKHSEYALSR